MSVCSLWQGKLVGKDPLKLPKYAIANLAEVLQVPEDVGVGQMIGCTALMQPLSRQKSHTASSSHVCTCAA